MSPFQGCPWENENNAKEKQDLFILFTHPDYRRRGVGQQFLDWGMAKADEMGVEMFLDATPIGMPLYKQNGFVAIEENVIRPRTDNPDRAWKEAEEKIGQSTWWLMGRPAGGKATKSRGK